MSKRVNIQYSVAIDEIPGETMGLVEKANEPLQESLSALKTITQSNIVTPTGLLQIDEIRRSLARVDVVLMDASNIIHGYLNYQSSAGAEEENSPDQIEPTQHSDSPAPSPELSTLIEEFRNSLGELDEVTTPKSP
jgi:hypothetical protein